MATITITEDVKPFISQGDVFRDIKYVYDFQESKDYVDIVELTFPYIIVLSQACDLRGAFELSRNSGKSTKSIMSILVAPFFEKSSVQSGDYLKPLLGDVFAEKGFNSNEYQLIENDFHYRFHRLKFIESVGIYESVIDFKQFFTLNLNYLYQNIDKRICTIEPIFKEQITLKFATFLSRVAIP